MDNSFADIIMGQTEMLIIAIIQTQSRQCRLA